jgi:hypothetical protein
MCPISNSPEMLLAQALKNDTVQATAGARLKTHNAFTMSRGGCFWSGSGISVIVEAGGRFTWFVRTKGSLFWLTYMVSSLVITSYYH